MPDHNDLEYLDTLLAGLGARIDEVDGELARLDSRADVLRKERTTLVRQRGVVNQRRTTLAIELTRLPPPPTTPVWQPSVRRTATPAVLTPVTVPVRETTRPQPVPRTPTPTAPAAAEPVAADEASALSVQAVLLTLGGLLLGVAAITFTAVAWTTFGPAGRAAVLGTVTLIALCVPWLLNRRGLAATGETISAVALLLVGLDGYAAHSVGLLGVDRWLPAPTYAGLVLLATALVAAGYRRVAPLHTPGFVALLTVQPVVPLLALGAVSSEGGSGSGSAPGSAAYAGVGVLAAVVAAQNVALLRWLRGVPGSGVERGRRALVSAFLGLTGVVAWAAGLRALTTAASIGEAVPGGVAVLAAAGVGLWLAGTVDAGRHLAAGSAVGAVVLAVGVPVSFVVTAPLPFGVVVVGAAFAVRALPDGWRHGAMLGTWTAAGVVGMWTLGLVAGRVLGIVDAGPGLAVTTVYLTLAARGLLVARHDAVVAGLAVTVLAVPVAPEWAVVGAVLFGASTVLTSDRRESLVRGVAAHALALVAVGTALPDPADTAVVLGTLVVGGLAVWGAATVRRTASAVAATALGTALAAAPGAAVAVAMATGLTGTVVRGVAVVAAAVVVLVAAGFGAVHRTPGAVPTGAAGAVPTGVLGAVPTGALGVVVGAVVGAVSVAVLAAGPLAVGARPLGALAGLLPAVAAVVGLVVRRHDVLTAGAVAAAIAVATDVVGSAVPDVELVVAAALVALVSAPVSLMSAPVAPVAGVRRTGVRAGAAIAGAAVTAVALPLAGGGALAAALAAVRPPWTTDLGGWAGLAAEVSVLGWQVPVALGLIAVAAALRPRATGPAATHRLPALLGPAVVALAVPAAFALPWWTPILLSGVTAAVLAVVAARLDRTHDVLTTAGIAGALGLHAAVVSLARPGTTAAALGGTAGVCLLVAVLTRVDRLRDAAVGGALAALPGAAAATAAALSVRPALILSLGLATASLALGLASLIGLARRAQLPAAGAVAGALVCVAVAAVVPSATGWDHLAAGLLLLGALARLWPRRRESRGAGGATLAFVAEMSQLVALLVPGAPVLTTAVVVAGTALVVRRLPAEWRAGPLVGLAVAGVAVGAVAAAATVNDAVVAVTALSPWGADLGGWLRPEPVGVDLLGWQPAAALVVLAVAAVTVRRASHPEVTRVSTAFALVMVALAVVHAPIGLALPWWAPAACATVAATAFGLLAVSLRHPVTAHLTAALAVTLAAYAGATALARPVATAVVLTSLMAAGTTWAARSWLVSPPSRGETSQDLRPAAALTGGAGVLLALAPVPAAAAAWSRALDPDVPVPHVTVAAAALALAGVLLARRVYPRWAEAGITVAVASVLLMPPGAPTMLHVAAAALIGMAASVPRGDPRKVRLSKIARRPAVLPWVAPAAVVFVGAVRVLVGEAPGTDVKLPAIALVTLGLGALLRVGGRGRWMPAAVLTPAAVTVLIAPPALTLAWPASVAAGLLVAVTCGLVAARIAPTDRPTRVLTALCCAHVVTVGGAALVDAAGTRATALTALGVVAGAGVIVGAVGRYLVARVIGWAVAAAGGLAFAVLADANGPYAAAVVLLAGAALLGRLGRHRAEVIAVECGSAAAALTAVAVAGGPRGTATVLVGYGAVLGLSALRDGRRWFALVAGGAELLAWWMLLSAADVGLIEAYTLPFALFALVGGFLGRRPTIRSWVTFGPALAAAFLPSLALVLVEPHEPMRRLLLGAGAIAVVVLGGARRWQAPVVVGAVVLTLVSLHELVVWWETLPRWIPLAAGGLLLVTVGATYERRRRDVRVIRTAVKEMR